MTKKTPDPYLCCLCGDLKTDRGNNPDPVASIDERCCDDCNRTRVIPARSDAQAKAQREQFKVIERTEPAPGLTLTRYAAVDTEPDGAA